MELCIFWFSMVESEDYDHGIFYDWDFHGLKGLDHSQKKFFKGECPKNPVFMRKTELLIQKSIQEAAQSVTGVLKGRRVE